MRHSTKALLAALALALSGIPGAAQAQAPFYDGKDLRVLINYSAGGPTDIEGRLFARHIGKHIKGDPTVTASNMAGAGGMVANNYLGKAAPKDGSVMGYLSGAAGSSVFSPQRFVVPLTDFEFVASQPGTSVYFVRTDAGDGIETPDDILKVEGVVAGGLHARQSKDLRMRLTLDMLGVDYQYVTGYKGTSKARAALEQGEIDLLVESPPSYRSVIHPTLVAEGKVVPLYFDPGIAADGQLYEPSPVEGLGIEPFHKLHERLKGEPPSGELWDAYMLLVKVNSSFQRLIVLPPGAPQEALTALREAVVGLNADEAFAEDAMRTIGFVPQYETGPDTNEYVRKTLNVPAEAKVFIDDYVAKVGR